MTHLCHCYICLHLTAESLLTCCCHTTHIKLFFTLYLAYAYTPARGFHDKGWLLRPDICLLVFGISFLVRYIAATNRGEVMLSPLVELELIVELEER